MVVARGGLVLALGMLTSEREAPQSQKTRQKRFDIRFVARDNERGQAAANSQSWITHTHTHTTQGMHDLNEASVVNAEAYLVLLLPALLALLFLPAAPPAAAPLVGGVVRVAVGAVRAATAVLPETPSATHQHPNRRTRTDTLFLRQRAMDSGETAKICQV